MASEEYQQLVAIANSLESRYLESNDEWRGSPFAWIRKIPIVKMGEASRQMVAQFLERSGFTVSFGEILTVNDKKIAVKYCADETEGYKFQNIRDDANFEFLFCLGVSPNGASAWVGAKADIPWNILSGQHVPADVQMSRSQCQEWMRPQNGDLSQICNELRRIAP